MVKHSFRIVFDRLIKYHTGNKTDLDRNNRRPEIDQHSYVSRPHTTTILPASQNAESDYSRFLLLQI